VSTVWQLAQLLAKYVWPAAGAAWTTLALARQANSTARDDRVFRCKVFLQIDLCCSQS
jgi:hypothetical protein